MLYPCVVYRAFLLIQERKKENMPKYVVYLIIYDVYLICRKEPASRDH